MGILYLIIFVITLVISIISLIGYIQGKSGMDRGHSGIVSRLTPVRRLSPQEVVLFSEVYKKKLAEDEYLSVFQHAGPVGYISVSVNHTETKEFAIGGIKVAGAGLSRLGRYLRGISFSRIAEDTQEQAREKARRIMEKNDGSPSLDEPEEALAEFNHRIEVVFLKDDRSKPGYLVQFDDWRLQDVVMEPG